MDIKERFWANTRVNNEHEWGGTNCIDWTAFTDKDGYGKFKISRLLSPIAAHRFAFQMLNGEIPKGVLALHRCDRPCCVNPEHIFLGTQADNMKDKVNKGRCPKGETHGMCKTTEDTVRLIKRFLERHPPRHLGGQLTFLSRWLDVSAHVVSDISRGKTWRHVQ